MVALQTAAASLADADNFVSFSATSANTTVLSATASADAVAGSYQVDVTALATSQQVRSSSFTAGTDVVGTGTLTLQVGSGTAFDVTIDSSNETLDGIAAAINEAGTDVTAAVVDDGGGNFYLTLASSETGADNTISLTMADDDSNNLDAAGLSIIYPDPPNQTLTVTLAAVNALLSLNGIAVERDSNIITDLVTGVTLTLNEADPGNPFALTVTQDFSTITEKVETFVAKYNAVVGTFDTLQSYDADAGSGGILQGDSTTNQLRSRLQSLLYEGVDGLSDGVNGLSRLGVEVGRDGTLTVNSDTLTTAVEENTDQVISFFSNDEDGNDGIGRRFDDLLEGYLASSTGLLATKEEGLQASIDDIGDQVERINFRLNKKEENLRQQFLNLETLLAGFQATQGALDQQLQSLANLSSYISTKK